VNEELSIVDALDELRPGAEWSIDGRDYDQLNWLDKSQTKPTLDELNEKLSAMNAAEPLRILRLERDRFLKETDWRANSDLIMSEEWKIYRQRLRDLPEGNSPNLNSDGTLDKTSVNWPTPPS
tara:strand:+ start:272 stop:640 length:369 start_codon:yes stop_codon:yes gene_type:complete